MDEAIRRLHKLTALADELEWYFASALTGKICEANQPEAQMFGSQHTPVSNGLSEGFSVQDIAHFYVVRELGSNWVEEILENLNEAFLNKLRVAFEEFGKDVRFEKRFAVEKSRSVVNVDGT